MVRPQFREHAGALGAAQHWLVKGDGVNAGGGQQIYFAEAAHLLHALEHGGHVANYAGSVKIPLQPCGAVQPVAYHQRAQCLFAEQFLMNVRCAWRLGG